MKDEKGLCVEMLGRLRVLGGGAVVAQFTPQQTGALLALLALNLHRPCSRETLIETIWPNADAEQGRVSLRQSLYKLRQQLEPSPLPEGGPFLRNREEIQLNPAAISTDVLTFESLLHEGSADPPVRLRRLIEAVDLYQDDLLPGFYQEVFALERRRLQRAFQSALRDLAITAELLGRQEEAIASVRRAAGRLPGLTEIRVELMRLTTGAGLPAETLREYENLQDLWKRDTAKAPDEEVRGRAAQYAEAARAMLRIAPTPESAARPVDVAGPKPAEAQTIPVEPLWRPDEAAGLPMGARFGHRSRARSAGRLLAVAALLIPAIVGTTFLLRSRRTERGSAELRLCAIIDLDSNLKHTALDPVLHRLYLPNTGLTGPDGVSVVDTQTNRVVGTIEAGYGLSGVATDPVHHWLYIGRAPIRRITTSDSATGKTFLDCHSGTAPAADMAFVSGQDQLFALCAQPPALTSFDADGNLIHNQPLDCADPVRLVLDPRFLRAFVVSRGGNAVQVFDLERLELITNLVPDVSPVDLAVDDEHNRIFIINSRSQTLDEFDGTTYERIRALPLKMPPRSIALDPETGRLYISGERRLLVVNAETLEVEQRINAKQVGAIALAIDPVGRRLYTLSGRNICVYALP
jgi:DNA-binding SARP family transcriptional activator